MKPSDSLSAEGAANMEDLKLAALYDGWHPNGIYGYTNHSRQYFDGIHRSVETMEYHSSWEWQVPLFSKVAKKMRSLSWPRGSSNRLRLPNLREDYSEAIEADDPAAGFAVIVEAIQWLAEQSKKGK